MTERDRLRYLCSATYASTLPLSLIVALLFQAETESQIKEASQLVSVLIAEQIGVGSLAGDSNG